MTSQHIVISPFEPSSDLWLTALNRLPAQYGLVGAPEIPHVLVTENEIAIAMVEWPLLVRVPDQARELLLMDDPAANEPAWWTVLHHRRGDLHICEGFAMVEEELARITEGLIWRSH